MKTPEVQNSLQDDVRVSLIEKGFYPAKCLQPFTNGFEITEDIGFGHSYIVGYVDAENVALTYRELDNGDSHFYGVLRNNQARNIINSCLDEIVEDDQL